MIQIPIRVDYGVRALVDIATNDRQGPVKTSDIASRTSIPESYLVRILNTFKKLEILESLDSLFSPVYCIDDPEKCTLSPSCAQRDIWIDVQKSVHSVLSQTTIADLVTKTSIKKMININ